jgi:hypothetical protein
VLIERPVHFFIRLASCHSGTLNAVNSAAGKPILALNAVQFKIYILNSDVVLVMRRPFWAVPVIVVFGRA